jgi:hypothetical protein
MPRLQSESPKTNELERLLIAEFGEVEGGRRYAALQATLQQAPEFADWARSQATVSAGELDALVDS